MKRIFLVTGYPRSRTAWLAAFLSSGRTLCLHEPMHQFDRHFIPMAGYVEELPHVNVGISDSAIPALRSLFSLPYSHCPVLVVERDKGACLQSLKNYYGFSPRDHGEAILTAEKAFDETEKGLETLEDHFQTVKRISFDSLRTVEGARAAWEFCCPGEAFDAYRYAAMERIVCNPRLE